MTWIKCENLCRQSTAFCACRWFILIIHTTYPFWKNYVIFTCHCAWWKVDYVLYPLVLWACKLKTIKPQTSNLSSGHAQCCGPLTSVAELMAITFESAVRQQGKKWQQKQNRKKGCRVYRLSVLWWTLRGRLCWMLFALSKQDRCCHWFNPIDKDRALSARSGKPTGTHQQASIAYGNSHLACQ